MTPVLQITHLSKSLGKKPILHDINLTVNPGEIFGFLGPNGSGKTTTIKLILGLLKIQTGEIKINGFHVEKDFEQAMECVGGIIENPQMYKFLTGRQNLNQYRRMYHQISQSRIDEVVKIVKLENRIDDKIKKYSLGMCQRLGVAQALLHQPKLLILDEPTNGLDPAGIRDLRDLLKTLTKETGMSVFVSSHLLSEMELMCDRFGILDEGKIIDIKAIDDMKAVESHHKTVYHFELSDNRKAEEIIRQLYADSHPHITGENMLEIAVDKKDVPKIVQAFVGGGVDIYLVQKMQKSLEQAFLEATHGSKGQIR